MEPATETLVMYGTPSEAEPLPWAWVDEQLATAGTYWVSAHSAAPHPRPVWGVWVDHELFLSVGSPTLARRLRPGQPTTVHLDSGTDVVIVDGTIGGPRTDDDLVAAYDAKYDWSYDLDVYGPLLGVAPTTVVAWRSAGWAGREGFASSGRWRF